MNLFALTTIPGARVIRFPLTQELQQDIQAAFQAQYAAFQNDIVEVVPFDGRYRPDEGELLTIEEFEDVDGLQNAVANPLQVEQFNPEIHSLVAVKALFTGVQNAGNWKVLIQFFESRRLLSTKGMAIFFSENTFRKMTDAGLTLDTKLLAVLENGTLTFQSFHYLRRVFDVDDRFNAATQEEVVAFASHAKLSVENLDSFVQAANPVIRKKIALIQQSGVLDKFTAQQIVATAQTFNLAINVSPDNKIMLPTNKTELRRLLRFLDEDYYESPLSQTRFISNSKRVAG